MKHGARKGRAGDEPGGEDRARRRSGSAEDRQAKNPVGRGQAGGGQAGEGQAGEGPGRRRPEWASAAPNDRLQLDLTDPRAMRGVGPPIAAGRCSRRSATRGTLTANAGQRECSASRRRTALFHLRTLGEVTASWRRRGGGKGRERPWRSGLQAPELAGPPGGMSSSGWPARRSTRYGWIAC